MCGIVGYIGKKQATPILLQGLRALEYRGYDSAGMYLSGKGVLKRAGKVAALAEAVTEDFTSTAGIAHTRWATHGTPCVANAHPHSGPSHSVWVVHNGIIENYAELKAELSARGATFTSDTDTEVLAALIEQHYTPEVLLEEAVAKALSQVRGTYGLAVASTREPAKLVAARLGSPLMLGIGASEYFIASDATAILSHTRDVVYLDDHEIAVLSDSAYRVLRPGTGHIEKRTERLEWDVEDAKKKGYEHFMLKEIMEIPEVLENTMRGRLLPETGEVNLGGLRDVLPRLKEARRIIITGCGSAYYAGLIGELLIEELAGIPVEVEIASELRYRRFTMDPKHTVLIAVSQSGETLDTLEAIREAKRHGMLTLGIVNVVGSSITRETDAGVHNHAGPEIGVASTKAFVSQITVLAMIAVLLGRQDSMAPSVGMSVVRELAQLPAQARTVLARHEDVARIAKKYAAVENAFFLGRKFQGPIAFEGALKLKEVSYIHAEGYGAGEMKHGPIALIDDAFLSVVIAPKDPLYEKTRGNIEELRARGGAVLALTTDGSEHELATLADEVLTVPSTREELLPMLTTIPLQLFAYYTAKERGLPVDQPRNLAKSVTVE